MLNDPHSRIVILSDCEKSLLFEAQGLTLSLHVPCTSTLSPSVFHAARTHPARYAHHLPHAGKVLSVVILFPHMRVFALTLWGKRYSRVSQPSPLGRGPRQRWIGCPGGSAAAGRSGCLHTSCGYVPPQQQTSGCTCPVYLWRSAAENSWHDGLHLLKMKSRHRRRSWRSIHPSPVTGDDARWHRDRSLPDVSYVIIRKIRLAFPARDQHRGDDRVGRQFITFSGALPSSA